MFQFPRSAVFAVPVAAVLMAGFLMPASAQSAPDPDPQIRAGGLNRTRANRSETLRGTVARVYGARSFDLRADSGRTYRVEMPFSVGLQSGTDVRVRGDLNGSTFYARTVTVGDFGDRDENYGGGTTNDHALDIEGRVTRINGTSDLEIRSDSGTTYRVITNSRIDNAIRVGDRVQTSGDYDGQFVRAGAVRAIDNSAPNGGYGILVDFPATIESIDLYREEATVLANNGSIYTLRASRTILNDFRVGQRVRVRGNWAYQRVEVSELTRGY